MAIKDSQAKLLNHSMRANHDVNLGTLIQQLQTVLGASGSFTVTNAQMNGSAVIISTGLSTVNGWMVTVARGGSPITMNTIAGSAAGTLISKTATNYVGGSPLLINDKVTWVAFA